mmetsp:Transcript_24579/g.37123  ORF Transcript_24579/g.37123 Transcript_24579/m.37123 type:complete len:80 (+) Transcript_24579:78-317(+)
MLNQLFSLLDRYLFSAMRSFMISSLCAVQDVGTRLLFGVDKGTTKQHFYSLIDKTMKGEEVSMSKYKGRILCVVNVASQ